MQAAERLRTENANRRRYYVIASRHAAGGREVQRPSTALPIQEAAIGDEDQPYAPAVNVTPCNLCSFLKCRTTKFDHGVE